MEREDFDYDPDNPKLRKGAALVLYGTLLEKGFAEVKDPNMLPPRCQEIVMEFPVRGSTKHIVRIYTSISPRRSFRAEGKEWTEPWSGLAKPTQSRWTTSGGGDDRLARWIAYQNRSTLSLSLSEAW
jgi:hypothetical protein